MAYTLRQLKIMDSINIGSEISIEIEGFQNINRKNNINNFITKKAIVCCIGVVANAVVISNAGITNTQNINYLGSAIYESTVYNNINKDNLYINGNVKNNYNHSKLHTEKNKTTVENITFISEYNSTVIANKIEMKGEDIMLKKASSIKKVHVEMISISAILVLICIIGFSVFSSSGIYLIHPSLYLFGIIMGLGWGATAIASVLANRRNE